METFKGHATLARPLAFLHEPTSAADGIGAALAAREGAEN